MTLNQFVISDHLRAGILLADCNQATFTQWLKQISYNLTQPSLQLDFQGCYLIQEGVITMVTATCRSVQFSRIKASVSSTMSAAWFSIRRLHPTRFRHTPEPGPHLLRSWRLPGIISLPVNFNFTQFLEKTSLEVCRTQNVLSDRCLKVAKFIVSRCGYPKGLSVRKDSS